MKLSRLSFALTLLITFTALAADPTGGDAKQTGRYILYQGKLTTLGTGGVTLSNDVWFKLDTQTGRTWKFFSLNVNSRSMEGWVECKIDPKFDVKPSELEEK